MDTEEPQESWGHCWTNRRCPGKLGLTGEWKDLLIKWGHLNMEEETTAGVGEAKYRGGPDMV